MSNTPTMATMVQRLKLTILQQKHKPDFFLGMVNGWPVSWILTVLLLKPQSWSCWRSADGWPHDDHQVQSWYPLNCKLEHHNACNGNCGWTHRMVWVAVGWRSVHCAVAGIQQSVKNRSKVIAVRACQDYMFIEFNLDDVHSQVIMYHFIRVGLRLRLLIGVIMPVDYQQVVHQFHIQTCTFVFHLWLYRK